MKHEKLVEVAKMYYQLDLSQQEIAEQLGISRPSVSRMLQQAKEKGIVQVRILDSFEDADKLSELLKSTFNLKHCIVVSVPIYKQDVIKRELGKVAANYIGEIVNDGDIIGTTWGTTLHQVSQNVQPKNVKGVTVVQLNGGVSYSETNTYASEILNDFSSAFNTVPYFLPLPAIVDHPVVANAIMSDRHIRSVLDLGAQSNIAVYTVGEINDQSTLFNAGYYTTEDLDRLKNQRAVGDICSRIFDDEGRICSQELDERTIGIKLPELRKKEYSILVVGGINKVDGVYGALKGEFSNVFITDQHTARSLLEKEGRA